MDTTDPAPAPVASKEPERGKIILVSTPWWEVSNHIRYGIRFTVRILGGITHYLSLSLCLSPLNVPKTGFPWSIPPDLARLTTSSPVTTIIFCPVQGFSTRTPPNSRTSSPEGVALWGIGEKSSPDSQTPIFFEILCGLLFSSWPKASDEADGNTGGPQPGFFRITGKKYFVLYLSCLLYTSPSPRDRG